MSDIPTWHERAEAHPDHQSGMVSEGMIRARMGEEIADLRAEIERTYALLKDPNVVAINMLRGIIALPSVEQIKHIYQDRLLLPDVATVAKERDEARGGGGAAAKKDARDSRGLRERIPRKLQEDRVGYPQRAGGQTMSERLIDAVCPHCGGQGTTVRVVLHEDGYTKLSRRCTACGGEFIHTFDRDWLAVAKNKKLQADNERLTSDVALVAERVRQLLDERDYALAEVERLRAALQGAALAAHGCAQCRDEIGRICHEALEAKP